MKNTFSPKTALGGIALFLALMLTAGCAGVNQNGTLATRLGYGYLHWSAAVTDDFMSNTVRPEYNYFYSGPDASPRAVIGIGKSYRLVSRFWKPVDLTPAIMKSWNWWMNASYGRGFGDAPRGYEIVDQGGEPVGVWYSRSDWTVISSNPGNAVIVYTPIEDELHAPGREGSDR